MTKSLKRDRIEVRLPKTVAREFKRYAARESSVSEVLRRYIRAYIKRHRELGS